MKDGLNFKDEDYEGIKKFVETSIPAGRFGTPEEVAQLFAFVASEKATWLVGLSINIDGGQSHMNM